MTSISYSPPWNLFSSFSASGRTTLGLLTGGLLVLVLIVALSMRFGTETTEQARQFEQEHDVMLAAEGVLDVLLNAESAKRGYLLTERTEFLKPYHSAQNRLNVEFERLEQAVENRAWLAPEAADLQRLARARMEEIQKTVELALAGERDKALELVQSEIARATMERVSVTLTTMIENAKVNAERRLHAIEVASGRMQLSTIVGGLSIVFFAAAAVYIVMNKMLELQAAQGKVQALNTGLEERVAERTQELTSANEEVKRFAYIVSHDLRAPLVNVMGFTSELEAGTNILRQYFTADNPPEELANEARTVATEDVPEAVDFIRASTEKMDNLIGTILKLSREGRRKLTPERIDLEQLISQAAASLQHQIDEAGATVDIADDIPSLVSDRTALEQVFGNLLDNAVKYLEPGRPGVIKVSAEQTGGRVKVRIADNGRGIADNDLERIFELFRRAGAQNVQGDGVGLAHVRALVRRLGGDVSVQSKRGEGSSFTVDLPKKARFAEASEGT